MKIYISADMEGVGGIVSYEQIDSNFPAYQKARNQMNKEIKAAVSGALAGGADEVIVNDAHDNMQNLLPELLNRRARLISGAGKPLSMVQGIEGADASIFLGYHAMAGTDKAVLDHTFSGKIYRLYINGKETGETGFNAAIAGYYQVPVLMVSGDAALSREAIEFLPEVSTVVVKEAIGRTSAQCIPTNEVCSIISHEVHQCVSKFKSGIRKIPPLVIESPVELKVELITTEMADLAKIVPGFTKINGRTVQVVCDDIPDMVSRFFTLLRLTGGYKGQLI